MGPATGDDDAGTTVQRSGNDTSLAQLLIGAVRAEGDLSFYGDELDAAVAEASIHGASSVLAQLNSDPLASGELEYPSTSGEAAHTEATAAAEQAGEAGHGRGKGMAALQAALRRPRGSIDSLYDDNGDGAEPSDESDEGAGAGDDLVRHSGGGDDGGFRSHSPQFGALDDATADERLHLVARGLFQRCVRTPSRPARRDEIRLCHSEEHLAQVDALRAVDEAGRRLGTDTFANEHTHTAALLAAGSVLAVTESVMRGNTRAGIALVRPPGHHAEPDAIMGFCLLNNAAIAAAAARRHMGARRVLILDWDVHHGNGTEACFVDDPSVMYVSLHRYEPGFFPGTGDPHDVGVGRGAGFTVNVGWPEGDMRDADYAAAFDTVIMPIARQFNPDLVIVSAGFDAAVEDPLGGCLVTPAGFAMMASRLRELANGKLVVALEGGYNLAAIALCTEAVTRILLGEAPPQLPVVPSLQGPSPQPGSPGLHGVRARPNAWDDLGQSPSPHALAIDRAASSRSDWDGAFDSEQDRELSALTPQPAAMAAILTTIEAHSPHWPALRRIRAAFHHSGVQALRRRASNLAADKHRAHARSMREHGLVSAGAHDAAEGQAVATFGDSPVPSSSSSLTGTLVAPAHGEIHPPAGSLPLSSALAPHLAAPFSPGIESPAAAPASLAGELGAAMQAPPGRGIAPAVPSLPAEVSAQELLHGLTLSALERGMTASLSPAVMPGRGRLGSHDGESASSSSTSSVASGDDDDPSVSDRLVPPADPTASAPLTSARLLDSQRPFPLMAATDAAARAPKRPREAAAALSSVTELDRVPDPKRGHH